MLARLLIIAVFSAVVATFAAAFWFGVSFWMLPVVYALTGSTTLLVGSAMGALASSMPAAGSHFDRAAPQPAPVRVRQ